MTDAPIKLMDQLD